jgi:CO dehydrogenase/acetyl-CoA synthase beta subunit
MEQGSIKKLKFDNRLSRRKGWLSNEEEKTYLEALPDVADKIATPEDDESEEVAEQVEAAPEDAYPAVAAFEVQTEEVASPAEPESELLSAPLSSPPSKEL